MYDMLENTIVPLYYTRTGDGLPHEWIKVAKEAIRTVAPKFSARRMLIDYVDNLYGPASGTSPALPPSDSNSEMPLPTGAASAVSR
jgi:glucan phosphorylase